MRNGEGTGYRLSGGIGGRPKVGVGDATSYRFWVIEAARPNCFISFSLSSWYFCPARGLAAAARGRSIDFY